MQSAFNVMIGSKNLYGFFCILIGCKKASRNVQKPIHALLFTKPLKARTAAVVKNTYVT